MMALQAHRAHGNVVGPLARRGLQQPCIGLPGTRASQLLWNAPVHRNQPCGRVTHVTCAGKIREVTENELEVEVANRDRPLIIDFFATWCGPCVLLAKELEEVADKMGDRVQILKVDCDKNEQISSALQIQGLPTMVFVGMDPKKPALRTEGLLPAQAILEIVERELFSAEAAAAE